MHVASQRIRILLVEDSEDDAYFFELELKKVQLPCDYTCVLDGRQAIDYLERCRQNGELPELIFLDLKLPVFCGFEVLGWVNRQHFLPPLNIVILSGSDQKADINQARELGAADYIVKPITADAIRQRLSSILERLPAPREQSEPTAITRGAAE